MATAEKLSGYRDEVKAVNAIVTWLKRFDTPSTQARILADAKRVLDEETPETTVRPQNAGIE